MISSNERELSMEQLMPLFQEVLAAGKSVTFSPKGTSMLPMLRQGRDTVTLSPVPERLRKYDLPLYRRDNGQFVLHRIIRVGETYTCMGDNQYKPEPGLRRDQMIAVMTSFCRNGRTVSADDAGYRFYCRLWCAVRPLRRVWKAAFHRVKRLLRRIVS